jgi:hypothetical protein
MISEVINDHDPAVLTLSRLQFLRFTANPDLRYGRVPARVVKFRQRRRAFGFGQEGLHGISVPIVDIQENPRTKRTDEKRHRTVVAEKRGKSSYRDAGGRDSTAVPSPGPFPARRINEMTLAEQRRSNQCHARSVSREGFTNKKTASVATANCLNGGVHPTLL